MAELNSLALKYIESGYTKERIKNELEKLALSDEDNETLDIISEEIVNLDNGKYDDDYSKNFGKRVREEEQRKNIKNIYESMKDGSEINWKDEYLKYCNANITGTVYASSDEMKNVYTNKLETGSFEKEFENYDKEREEFDNEVDAFIEFASESDKYKLSLIIDTVNERTGQNRRIDWEEKYEEYKSLGGDEFDNSGKLSRAIYTNKLENNIEEIKENINEDEEEL